MKTFPPSALKTSQQADSTVVGPKSRPVAWNSDGPVNVATFLGHVRGIEAQLPSGRYIINLCEDRYRFMVVFYACALAGKITLLPQTRTPAALDQVDTLYPGSFCVADSFADAADHRPRWTVPDPLPTADGPWPQLDDASVVAIGFTSGSTGLSTAHAKTWQDLRICSTLDYQTLQKLWLLDRSPSIVATVPPQHMYGMEMSVLVPIVTQSAVHAARPFYPQDIAQSLAEVPEPRILVTTPIHLRVLVESRCSLPSLAGIVSATAALSADLAKEAQHRLSAPVCEFFGATETLVCAWRQPVQDCFWTRMPGVRLVAQQVSTTVYRSHLPAAVELADYIALQDDGRFQLCGRASDLLEVAGKRASLADLTQRLLAIPGVSDGVIVQMPSSNQRNVCRLAAIVVAPGLEEESIMRTLRGQVDPVFLPRRIRFVDVLPRSPIGKIRQSMLMALLQDQSVPGG